MVFEISFLMSYLQVIHMITAAKGAEKFYTLENSTSRSEDLDTARMLDTKAAEAWVGHPNVDSVRCKIYE